MERRRLEDYSEGGKPRLAPFYFITAGLFIRLPDEQERAGDH